MAWGSELRRDSSVPLATWRGVNFDASTALDWPLLGFLIALNRRVGNHSPHGWARQVYFSSVDHSVTDPGETLLSWIAVDLDPEWSGITKDG